MFLGYWETNTYCVLNHILVTKMPGVPESSSISTFDANEWVSYMIGY